jgi:hypothetical protein
MHLRNGGDMNAFEPDKFGDEIIVERSIHRHVTGGVRLMDRNRNVIYNVCVRRGRGRPAYR